MKSVGEHRKKRLDAVVSANLLFILDLLGGGCTVPAAVNELLFFICYHVATVVHDDHEFLAFQRSNSRCHASCWDFRRRPRVRVMRCLWRP